MDLNLALSSVRNKNCSDGQYGGGCSVQFRETRCSYFLNFNLQGLRADDIQVEMDKEKRVIIRGQRYSKGVGMIKWKSWVVENGRRRRRSFKMPEEVNVGAIRGSFEQGILYLVMPKFRRSKFGSYHINSHSAHGYPAVDNVYRRKSRRRTREVIVKSQRYKSLRAISAILV